VQPQDSLLIGRPARAVAADYGLLPVALLGANGVLQSRPSDVSINAGDRLVAFVTLPNLERLLRREPLTPVEASRAQASSLSIEGADSGTAASVRPVPTIDA